MTHYFQLGDVTLNHIQSNWMIMLQQSFTDCMPLLTKTSKKVNCKPSHRGKHNIFMQKFYLSVATRLFIALQSRFHT